MSDFWKQITTIVTAIIGLAIVAVLVSRNANTAGIVGVSAQGLSSTIQAAVSPVTSAGGTGYSTGNLYSTGGFYGG